MGQSTSSEEKQDFLSTLPPEIHAQIMDMLSTYDLVRVGELTQSQRTLIKDLLVREYRLQVLTMGIPWFIKDPFPSEAVPYLLFTKYLTLPWLAEHALKQWPDDPILGRKQVISGYHAHRLRQPVFTGRATLEALPDTLVELLFEKVPADGWTFQELLFHVCTRRAVNMDLTLIRYSVYAAFLARLVHIWCREDHEACCSYLLVMLANTKDVGILHVCGTLFGYVVCKYMLPQLAQAVVGWEREWFFIEEIATVSPAIINQCPLLLTVVSATTENHYQRNLSLGLWPVFEFWLRDVNPVFLPSNVQEQQQQRPDSLKTLDAVILQRLKRCMFARLAQANMYCSALLTNANQFWVDADLFYGNVYTLLVQLWRTTHVYTVKETHVVAQWQQLDGRWRQSLSELWMRQRLEEDHLIPETILYRLRTHAFANDMAEAMAILRMMRQSLRHRYLPGRVYSDAVMIVEEDEEIPQHDLDSLMQQKLV